MDSIDAVVPIKLDCQDLRSIRQQLNNKCVYRAIKTNNSKLLEENTNKQELNRVLDEICMSFDELMTLCSTNDIMTKILAGRISKLASRQGGMDEKLQIQTCNYTASKYDISIEKLSPTAYRATKSGAILSNRQFKSKKIPKDECLKSFDGKISGKMKGWLCAKVVFGNGGHQDNVFEEIDVFCSWVEKFHKNEDEKYVMLIDTDREDKFNRLKEKYKDVNNIIITDHCDLQKYIIDNYSLISQEI